MKTKKDNRSEAFILLLTEAEAEQLRKLAESNDHAPSKQAYLIVRNYLKATN